MGSKRQQEATGGSRRQREATGGNRRKQEAAESSRKQLKLVGVVEGRGRCLTSSAAATARGIS